MPHFFMTISNDIFFIFWAAIFLLMFQSIAMMFDLNLNISRISLFDGVLYLMKTENAVNMFNVQQG